MSDADAKLDDAKGRVKEAAGTLSGDRDLEAEGKLDRASGAVKDKLGDVREKAEGAVDAVKDKLQGKR